MFELKFDVSEFQRKTLEMNAAIDQIPFALSLTLNRAIQNARKVLIQDTWPSHVTVRNRGFIQRALRMKFSTKSNLRAEIFDDLGRAHLQKHAKGGVKIPKGKNLAIPIKGRVTLTSHGVMKSQRPRAMAKRKKAFVTEKGIFLKTTKGAAPQLIYAFKSSAKIKPDVPFYEDFYQVVRNEMRTNFGPAMARAMKTRK